jgi:hypothetical protein
MKKGLTSISMASLFLIACSTEQGEMRVSEIAETELNSTDSLIEQVDSIHEEVVKNDLTMENLIGQVKTMSWSSVTIDDDGEEYGMGGYHEHKEYNKQGRFTELSTFGCCGAMNEEFEYRYNSEGQLTHRILRMSEPGDDIDFEHFYLKEKYFYNDEGVLVKKKIAGEDQVLAAEHAYEFDSNGLLVTEDIQDFNGNDSETISFLTSDTKKTETHVDEEGEYKRVYFYDDKGQLESDELHLKNGDIQETKYSYLTFDDQDNWTKRESKYRYVYTDGTKEDWQNSLRETRTIEYY